jgi:hypothetical protein
VGGHTIQPLAHCTLLATYLRRCHSSGASWFQYPKRDSEVIPLSVFCLVAAGQALLASGRNGRCG